MVNRLCSPLRYPGGKAKLAPFVKSILLENNLVGCDYIEPFAGGAGIALSLLFEEYASTITISDYDRSLYAFWHSVVHEGDRFCAEIEKARVDVEMCLKQRLVQKSKSTADLFELGFSTFFLNRVNVSGVIKGGIIGGLQQKGKYKIDARFNKTDLIKRILRISQYKHRIKVRNKDAINLLRSGLENKFVYLDPPYVKKARGLYMNFYEKKDHEDIAYLLLSGASKARWLLSYDQDELIDRLYRKCANRLTWSRRYGASNKEHEEYVFASKDLKINLSERMIA